jgi:hypothetical protein
VVKNLDTKKVTLGLLAILIFAGVSWGVKNGRLSFRKADISSGISTKATPRPKTDTSCTLYTNIEYGFSICYPLDWALPEEEKITPSQQHLYQITLNPYGEAYLIDLYDQPSPVSLEDFVRNYFPEVNWSSEVTINDREALQFVLSQKGSNIGAVAFKKANSILIISTPEKKPQEDNWQQLANDEILTQLRESFQWVE